MKIKAIFPGNFYSRRKIKIIDDHKKVIDYLYPNQTIEIKNPHRKLKFKLDYHKQTIDIDNDQQNLIVFFKFRPYFPFNYIDLFKNALSVKKVSNEDFDNQTQNILNEYSDHKIKVNYSVYASLFIQAITDICIIIFTILKPDLFNEMKNFLFLISLISLVSIIVWMFNLQNTYENEYKTRIISAILLFAGFSLITKGYLSILLLISSLSLTLLNVIYTQKLAK